MHPTGSPKRHFRAAIRHPLVERPRSTRGLGAVAVCVLVVTAVGALGAHASSGLQRGGNLVIARQQDSNTLDPAKGVTPAEIYVMDQLYGTLFVASPDGKSIQPSLATGYKQSRDGRTWTITLRRGLRFSDGSSLTSADVKFSLDRSRKANAAFSYLLGVISRVSTPNSGTVVIRTAHPSAPLLADLSAWVAAILPKNLEGKSANAFFEHPVGAGPFTFASWTRGTSLKVVRNGHFWQSGKPYLGGVTWTVVPDANTRVTQLRGGQADIAEDIPVSQIKSVNALQGLAASSFPAAWNYFLIFSEAVKPFQDVHVRRAIAYAIDRKSLVNATLFGAGAPACSIIPKSIAFYDLHTPCLTYNVAKARAELARSSAPRGFKSELLVDNLPTNLAGAQIIQSQLKQIGIDLSLKVVDSGQLYTTYYGKGNYKAGLASWAYDIPDPDEQISFMFDPKGGGSSYYTGYNNPTVTKLVHEAAATLSHSRRQALYNQIQAISAREVPHVPLYEVANAAAWKRTVHGFFLNPMGKRHLEDVWLSK